MAYHNHFSRDLPLHHFTDQTQQQFWSEQPNSNLKSAEPHHHHPFQPAPSWLNSALLHNYTGTNSNNNGNKGDGGSGSSNFLNIHVTAADISGLQPVALPPPDPPPRPQRHHRRQ